MHKLIVIQELKELIQTLKNDKHKDIKQLMFNRENTLETKVVWGNGGN